MTKRSFILFFAFFSLLFAFSACEEPETPVPDDPDKEPEVVAPVVSLEVDELERTKIAFTIKSDSPGDYAWAILSSEEAVGSAEDLFKSEDAFELAGVGMFDDSGTAVIKCEQLEGGKSYKLYAAARKINPYVYSELLCEDVSTEFSYEEMITLEKVSTDAVSYHIEMPEGSKAYRHMIVDYNDFLYFQVLVGVTYDSYLSAFGLGGTESKTYDYKWVQWDCWDNYATYFYSDTEYVIIAGPSESPADDSKVSPEDVKYLKFKTPAAEECPYEVAVDVSEISSLTATVTLTPEEGVAKYRALVMSEDDYQSFLFEGEEMIRRVVIGPWEDTSAEFTEAVTMPISGLMPETRYHVCIVAFDSNMRELYIEEVFTTSEPVGPEPEIYVEPVEVEEDWNSARVNLKLRNVVSALSFIHTRYAVDQVLNAPGNEDLTMDVVIRNNGTSFTSEVLAKAQTEEGCELQFSNLSPNTDYVFAVLATNSEYVSTYTVYDFKTGAEPVVESSLFDKLQGEYTATITDLAGETYSFDVTIADGVNDATRAEYAARNLLVCLGFDPIGVKYNSPEDLIKKGWAKTEEDANRNYGPKWFLEIDENDMITTYKHAIAKTYWDEVNMVQLVEYSAEGEAPMASFNGSTYWFKGTFWRDFSNPNREDAAMATTLIHDVDYEEATGVLTVQPVSHFKSWSTPGQIITEYPGVEKGKTWSGANNEVVFCGNSALVLTPKAAAKTCMYPSDRKISVPLTVKVDMSEDKVFIRERQLL